MTRRIRERKEVYLLYNLLLPLGILAYWIYASLFKKKKLTPLGERLGRLSREQLNRLDGKPPIWIQAVSVGEVLAVGPLIGLLQKEKPLTPILLTTTTLRGMEVAKRFEKSGVITGYFPVDFSQAMNRFIQKVRPRLLIMVETEFWPNCMTQLSRRNIPMVVINGRVSDRSFPRYKMLRGVIAALLEPVRSFLMQSGQDAKRLKEIGVPSAKIEATGNLKFDSVGTKIQELSTPAAAFLKEGPVWVAASTHDPEEKQLYQVYREVRKSFPALRWVVAPRHVERGDSLQEWFSQQGEKIIRWSRDKNQPELFRSDLSIILLDTIGELSGFYASADIVFMGGSLVPHGGQNPLEAAGLGKPVLLGSYFFNFREIRDQLLQQGGALEIRTDDEMKENLVRLLGDKEESRKIGEKARQFVLRNQGATLRVFKFLREKNLI